MVDTGNWVIIYHLPPIKGTRKLPLILSHFPFWWKDFGTMKIEATISVKCKLYTSAWLYTPTFQILGTWDTKSNLLLIVSCVGITIIALVGYRLLRLYRPVSEIFPWNPTPYGQKNRYNLDSEYVYMYDIPQIMISSTKLVGLPKWFLSKTLQMTWHPFPCILHLRC